MLCSVLLSMSAISMSFKEAETAPVGSKHPDCIYGISNGYREPRKHGHIMPNPKPAH